MLRYMKRRLAAKLQAAKDEALKAASTAVTDEAPKVQPPGPV